LADHRGIGHETRQPRNTWPWQLRVLSPPWLLLGSLALSASLWTIPWSATIHTGFSHKLEVTPDAVLVLGSWYLLIVGVGVIGFEVGRRLSPIAVLNRFPAELYYRYFTVIGAIGVAYTYGTVMVGDPMLIVDAVRHRTFNDVRLAFAYGPGVQTLRYATILAGGIALYEVCFRSRITRLAVLNLLLLALVAAAASRLSLAMAVLIAVGLAVREREIVHRIGLRILLLAVLAFAALTAFNYLRNANFYEENYGVRDPLTMNLSESVAYLGAPFQASIAAAGRAAGQNISAVDEELVPNPGGETDTVDWVTYDGGVPPTPTVGRVDDPGVVTSGKWALTVRMSNPSPQPQDKFLWVSDRAAVQVAPGDRLLLRAFVSGPASARSPIRLGVRRDDGSTTQDGIAPHESGITLRQTGTQRLLEGEYTALDDTSTIQLAIWKEQIGPRAAPEVAVDDVSLVRHSTAPAPKPPVWRSLMAYLVPTYLQPRFRDVEHAEKNYRRFVTIEATLTTNSSFAAMYGSLGNGWAYVVIGIACLLGATFAGHASRYRSYVFLGVFVVSYVFAELWRVYLFNYGVIQFLLLLLVLVPIGHPYVAAIRDRMRSRGAHDAG
jgi:hypothetical protein